MTRQLPLWASQDSRVIIFFRPGQLGNAESLFFSPGTCQEPSHYFPSVVKSLFLAAQHLCTKHCYGENITPDSPEGQPINAESLFFFGQAAQAMSSHYFFSAGLARQCRVIIFFGPDQLARAESFIFFALPKNK